MSAQDMIILMIINTTARVNSLPYTIVHVSNLNVLWDSIEQPYWYILIHGFFNSEDLQSQHEFSVPRIWQPLTKEDHDSWINCPIVSYSFCTKSLLNPIWHGSTDPSQSIKVQVGNRQHLRLFPLLFMQIGLKMLGKPATCNDFDHRFPITLGFGNHMKISYNIVFMAIFIRKLYIPFIPIRSNCTWSKDVLPIWWMARRRFSQGFVESCNY